MVKGNAGKNDGIHECPPASGLSESKSRHNFRLGDITWVKQEDSSWWPAQVVDESRVSSKPRKTGKHHALVRLYGTCQHVYVDPWSSNMEFKTMLKQENKSAMDIFHEVLEKELSHANSPGDDYAEEAANSKAKCSSRKVGKQKDMKRHSDKDLKESGVTDTTGHDTEDQYVAEEHQELRNNARTGVAAQKGGMQKAKCSSRKVRKQKDMKRHSDKDVKESGVTDTMGHDTEDQYVAEEHQELRNNARTGVAAQKRGKQEGLRDKTVKQFASVRSKDNCKMTETGTSVVRREGLRRSGRVNVKGDLDGTEEITSQLSDTSASEDVTEVRNRTSDNQNQHKDESFLEEIWAPHAEIRAMVKDILFGDIIASQHAAEMAYVDDVISGICGGNEANVNGDASASTKGEGGRGIKRSGSDTVEAESCNITHRCRKGKVDEATSNPNGASEGTPKTMNYCITENGNSKENNSNSLKGIVDATGRDAAMEEKPGQQSLARVK